MTVIQPSIGASVLLEFTSSLSVRLQLHNGGDITVVASGYNVPHGLTVFRPEVYIASRHPLFLPVSTAAILWSVAIMASDHHVLLFIIKG